MDEKVKFVRCVSGTVMAVNSQAVGLGFKEAKSKTNSKYEYAVALKCTCFVGNGVPALDLLNNFSEGSTVKFDAVLDENSQLPDVWKVVVLWARNKPCRNLRFEVEMWNHALKYFYHPCAHLACLLDGSQQSFPSTYLPEIAAVKFFAGFFRAELSHGNVYSVTEDDLHLLLDEAGADVKAAVLKDYDSLAGFIQQHYKVFLSQGNTNILPRREIQVSKYLNKMFGRDGH